MQISLVQRSISRGFDKSFHTPHDPLLPPRHAPPSPSRAPSMHRPFDICNPLARCPPAALPTVQYLHSHQIAQPPPCSVDRTLQRRLFAGSSSAFSPCHFPVPYRPLTRRRIVPPACPSESSLAAYAHPASRPVGEGRFDVVGVMRCPRSATATLLAPGRSSRFSRHVRLVSRTVRRVSRSNSKLVSVSRLLPGCVGWPSRLDSARRRHGSPLRHL